MPSSVSHYCQKCLAANPLGQEFCGRCGTRLMLVVEPSSARYEAVESAITTDEHILERISAVENRLTRLTERLERSLDLLLRQAQNSYFDRSLVKTLIGLLSEDGLVETSKLEKLWSDRCAKEANEQQEHLERDQLRSKILADPPAKNRKAFLELVGEGFVLIEDRQFAVGIDKLQRAAAMADSNSALNRFIGEHYFRSGNTQSARTYLTKAYELSPDDVRLSLLLGLACADEGDCEKAKELLINAIEHGGSCFAGHYGLGWLHLEENKLRKALSEFKRALDLRPSPEAHYVLGCLYYRLERDSLAIKHLRSAVELDHDYSEARKLLAEIYIRCGQVDLADEILQVNARPAGTKSRSKAKETSRKKQVTRPLFMPIKSRTSRLITGTDRRIAEALKEDALRSSNKN